MADVFPGWGELLGLVRRYEGGDPLPDSERPAALELAVSVGRASVPGVIGCSISLQQPDQGFVTPAAAGPVSLLLDEVQYADDDGPCLRAARTGQPQRLDPLATDPRWPELVRQARAHGVSASLSLPLLTAETPAALNLYAAAEGVLGSARATAVAGVVARATSALLMGGAGLAIEGLSAARIHRAIAERTLITRAQEVLMARHRGPAPEAYHRLAVRSAVESSPMWEVARRLLEAEGATAPTEPESEAGSASSSGEDVSA
jgi:hypothetical protein